MTGSRGPNDSTEQWKPQPGPGEPNPVASHPEQPRPSLPNPYPADVYGGSPYPVTAPNHPQGSGHPQPTGPAWGPANPNGPVPDRQWGAAPGWGQPAPGQWNPPGTPPSGPGQHFPGQNPYPGGQPYPGQQWGNPGPGYPQQYGAPQSNQWMPPVAPPAAPKTNPVKWIGIGLVVAALAAFGLLLAGSLGSKTLDQTAAERGVEQILTESYGVRGITTVDCPSGQQVQNGSSFECSVSIEGTAKTVTVTFTDDDGTYEVGRPR